MDLKYKKCTTDGRPPEKGYENAPTPQPIGPSGQAGAYWVLCEDERKKGFVRPVRDSYKHVGSPGPKYELRDLTEEEKTRYKEFNYVKFEAYPESERPITGRYWTQHDLSRINNGCGTVTTMGRALSETYARKPDFYGSTFCCACGTHLPVGEHGEFVWTADGTRVGT